MSSTPYRGFGLAPFGLAPFGYGSPTIANPNIGLIFKKTDNSIGGGRFIDPVTRDYAIDSETGRLVGQDSVQQLVYLALVTVKGSSAVTNLGQSFTSIQLKTENIDVIIKNEVNLALKKLITQKLITLNDVVVDFVNGAARIRVVWTDISQNKQVTTTI